MTSVAKACGGKEADSKPRIVLSEDKPVNSTHLAVCHLEIVKFTMEMSEVV